MTRDEALIKWVILHGTGPIPFINISNGPTADLHELASIINSPYIQNPDNKKLAFLEWADPKQTYVALTEQAMDHLKELGYDEENLK